jgi:hypothetical protein
MNVKVAISLNFCYCNVDITENVDKNDDVVFQASIANRRFSSHYLVEVVDDLIDFIVKSVPDNHLRAYSVNGRTPQLIIQVNSPKQKAFLRLVIMVASSGETFFVATNQLLLDAKTLNKISDEIEAEIIKDAENDSLSFNTDLDLIDHAVNMFSNVSSKPKRS